MKKLIALTACAAVITMSFTNCKKSEDNKSYSVTTYTTNNSTLEFYVNNEDKGKLPYVANGVSDCGDSKALNLSLDPGTYTIVVKDSVGTVKNASVLQIAEDATINSTVGNHSLTQVDKCVILEFSY